MGDRIGVRLSTSIDSFRELVSRILQEGEIDLEPKENDNVAHVLIDAPVSWAFSQLDKMNSLERARTVVVVQSAHPAYCDVVASYHISGVVAITNEAEIVSSIYAAASALRTYSWQSGLTYMELRVSRLLLKGFSTETAARELRVSAKTINAHVSNALSKLGHDSRAQFVAALLGQHRA